MIHNLILPLVDWGYGIWMIVFFVIVSLMLIYAVISMMSGGKKE